MYSESDSRVLKVLDFALRSSSRVLRLRAVCMLARMECDPRDEWLAVACSDVDPGVRDAAVAVIAWTLRPPSPPWPQREDPAFDRTAHLASPEDALDSRSGLRWEWEYAVEVWRDDGLLVGVFLCTSCQEDDQHAKRIALGQAVLAGAGSQGERFDPATAAAFIVSKRRIPRSADQARHLRDGLGG